MATLSQSQTNKVSRELKRSISSPTLSAVFLTTAIITPGRLMMLNLKGTPSKEPS